MIHYGSPRCGMPACPACRQELERAIRADERKRIRRALRRYRTEYEDGRGFYVPWAAVRQVFDRRDERARKESGS